MRIGALAVVWATASDAALHAEIADEPTTNQVNSSDGAPPEPVVQKDAPDPAPDKATSQIDDPDAPALRKKRLAKAKGSAALAGLIILGFAMVGLTWLGARFTRRYMFGPSGQPQRAKPTTIR